MEPPPQESSRSSLSSRLNKYALGCAILASTNSILLGYGNCPFPSVFPFGDSIIISSN